MKITKEKFIELTGVEPEHDDLERTNCPLAGQVGHRSCGFCQKCQKPVFMCNCSVFFQEFSEFVQEAQVQN